MTRIINIVPSIAEEASGPSYSVVRLCESLILAGDDAVLVALDWKPLAFPPNFLHTFQVGVGPRRLGRSPQMYQWLSAQCANNRVNVLHNHGMWQANSLYPAWLFRKNSNICLVYSPRGALSEWAMSHGSILKKLFWPLLQRPALQKASCFHATAESEYEDIRRLGFKQPVAVIPNGIDIVSITPKNFEKIRVLLFLGRIHKKKGLDILLRSWREVQSLYPNWRVVIAGGDEGYNGTKGYLKEMQLLSKELGLVRVQFVGNLYGAEKMNAYRSAELFVLPTYSENFGLTVAESLAAGTPVIVSKGAPWHDLNERGAGWWIDIGVKALVDCLKEAMSRTPAELGAMGERGRSWMQRDFTWSSGGKKMAETYRWLCDSSLPVPPWVRLN